MRRNFVIGMIFACLALACESKTSPDQQSDTARPRVSHARAAKPDQTAPPATAAELKEPTLASAMRDGQCNSQADCPPDNVCVAVMPGVGACTPARYADAPAIEAAPNGRPGAPVGLLDGQVLREQVMREQPVPAGQP